MVTRKPKQDETEETQEILQDTDTSASVSVYPFPTNKSDYLALHKLLLDLNVRSISDLEVLIARA